MKVLIEIDKARFKDIQRIAEVQLEMSHFQTAEQMIANGTPIPDNATNGDVIKALYPNERIGHCENCTDLGDIATFDDDWWNASYQKGGKE